MHSFTYRDPLGLVADGDKKKFDRLRFVELKHGRISMLAVAGYLVTEGTCPSPLCELFLTRMFVCSRNPSPWTH